MKNECSIVKDLFPLYIENMVSDNTVDFIETHLKKCTDCRASLDKMKNNSLIVKDDDTSNEQEILPLNEFKKKWTRKKILTVLSTSVITMLILSAGFFFIFIYGVPVSSDQVEVQTEFQYSEYGYLNQEFVFHFNLKDGKSLYEKTSYVSTNDIVTGVIIDLRTPIIKIIDNPDNFTYGYSYDGNTPPKQDFTVTVRYSDKTVVYSMTDEGLFKPQKVVEY